jgi:hypothetical protein
MSISGIVQNVLGVSDVKSSLAKALTNSISPSVESLIKLPSVVETVVKSVTSGNLDFLKTPISSLNPNVLKESLPAVDLSSLNSVASGLTSSLPSLPSLPSLGSVSDLFSSAKLPIPTDISSIKGEFGDIISSISKDPQSAATTLGFGISVEQCVNIMSGNKVAELMKPLEAGKMSMENLATKMTAGLPGMQNTDASSLLTGMNDALSKIPKTPADTSKMTVKPASSTSSHIEPTNDFTFV